MHAFQAMAQQARVADLRRTADSRRRHPISPSAWGVRWRLGRRIH